MHKFFSTVHVLCTEHTDHTHACQQHCMDLNLQQYGIETTLQVWNENGCMEWNWMHGMESIQCMERSWMYGIEFEMHGNEFPRDAWYWIWSVWDTCWWLYQLSTAFHCVMTLVNQDRYLRNDYQCELQVWLKWVHAGPNVVTLVIPYSAYIHVVEHIKIYHWSLWFIKCTLSLHTERALILPNRNHGCLIKLYHLNISVWSQYGDIGTAASVVSHWK